MKVVSLKIIFYIIQGASEIVGRTLKVYSTHCKDEKSHINMSSETLPFQ